MEIYKKQSLSQTFSVYFDRRMIRILLLFYIIDLFQRLLVLDVL